MNASLPKKPGKVNYEESDAKGFRLQPFGSAPSSPCRALLPASGAKDAFIDGFANGNVAG
jgi:hypothetical protein